MRARNIYQCDENCKKCNYINKKPTGYTIMDECLTDICPSKNEKLGNVDKLGGRHTDGYGWNPLGEFCGLCKHESCEECIKWANRDKKLRNNIPTQLKQEKTAKKDSHQNTEIKQVINKEEPKVKTDIPAITTSTNSIKDDVDMQTMLDKEMSQHTFVEREIVADNEPMDDFDMSDFSDMTKENKKLYEEIINNAMDDNQEDGDEIDFGFDETENMDYDEYGSIDFDDDDIPNPNEIADIDNDEDIENDDDNNEYEETDENIEVSKTENIQMTSTISPYWDIDEDEEFDEDDDAVFDLYETAGKLKASILFSAGTKIAKYQIREKGVLLTTTGTAKVTVKGSNESDGFSYCDPNRFPQYVRKGIMNGELYKNPNMQITDNSNFVLIYFHDLDGEMIEKNRINCGTSLPDADEDKVRKLLTKAMIDFSNQ